MRKWWMLSLALILILNINAATVFVCAGQVSPTVIKVGYLDGYGISVDESGEPAGYGAEYLKEISKYTGWKYQFVPCGWDEGMTSLEAGEIDLFGPMQKNQLRETKYDFHDQQIGIEYGAIYISEKRKDIYYNDVASIDGMRIATIENNFYNMRMEEYCEKNGISVELIYTEEDRYAEGLSSGAFDAVVAGSIYDIPGTMIAGKISTEPTYFATTKGNREVWDGLNAALEAIFLEDAYYEAALYQKYYGDKSISMPTFTLEEVAYLAENPTLRAVCSSNWPPIAYYNAQKQEFSGIGVALLKEICEEAGIGLEMMDPKSKEEGFALLDSGAADLIIATGEEVGYEQLSFAEPLLYIPSVIVGRTNINLDEQVRVGIAGASTKISAELKRRYPNFEYVEYPSVQALLEAMASGKESYAMMNYYSFDELTWKTPGRTYHMVMTEVSVPISIGLSAKTNPVLLSILNKAVKRISHEEINAITSANMSSRNEKVPIERILYENAGLIIAFTGLILAIIFAVIAINVRRTKNKLKKIAYVDRLTGLATLGKFRSDAEQLLKQAKSREYIIFYVDIDNFKYINDSFGYQIGDQALEAIASHFLEFSSYYILVGRLSADNFIFLAEMTTADVIDGRFRKISDAAHHLKGILPDNYVVTLSTGYYVIEDPTEDFGTLLDKANTARKEGKNRQLNSLMEYTSDMDMEMKWKKEVTLYMSQAMENREFKPYFQPKFDLNTEKIVGAEALVRWQHPDYGLLAPDRFVPLFEKNGFILKLDYFMFEEVCRLLARWKKEGVAVFPISINLSRNHLHNPDVTEDIRRIVMEREISPDLIEVELTESIVFNNSDRLVTTMRQIREAGFSISIDDFGSGYSSLNLLTDLPANVLKIDKGFVDRATATNHGGRVIQKVIEMARSIDLITVAEGVETAEQAQMLRDMGCDIAQGYYYAKPMPADEFVEMLK